MSNLHVVYRRSSEHSWDAYSRPASIHAGGRTLEQARDEFIQAASSYFGEEWPRVSVLEHLERPVADGVFVRTAIDRHTLDRDHVSRVLKAALTVPAQHDHLQATAILSSTGDVVFVAALTSDLLSWATEQIGRADAIHVACATGENMIWWMPLAAPEAEFARSESETLGDAGLTGDGVTIADLLASSPIDLPGSELVDVERRRTSDRRAAGPVVRSRRKTVVVPVPA